MSHGLGQQHTNDSSVFTVSWILGGAVAPALSELFGKQLLIRWADATQLRPRGLLFGTGAAVADW